MSSESIVGYRLSPRQSRLWQLQQDPARRGCAAALLRVRGAGPDAVRAAVDALVERHEVLRTTFDRLPGMPRALQVIGEGGVSWEDTADLRSADAASRGARIDRLWADAAGADGALPAARLVRVSGGEVAVLIRVNALAADALSLRSLGRELAALLAGAELDEAIPYVSVSEWLNDVLTSDAADAGRTFWAQQVDGAEAALPMEDEPGATVHARRAVPSTVAAELEAFAGRVGASGDIVLLSAFTALLHRLMRSPKVRLGVEMDGRTDAELQPAVGPFAQHVPMTVSVNADGSFRALVERLAEAHDDAAGWQETLDWEALRRRLLTGDGAEEAQLGPRVGFTPAPPAESFAAGGVSVAVERSRVPDNEFATHLVVRREGGLALELASSVLSAAQADRMLDRLATLLADAVARPEAPVSTLAAMSEAETAEALSVPSVERPSGEAAKPIHELFEAQAARTPGAAAARFDGRTLTYGELDRDADRRAHWLRGAGVGAEVRVGVMMKPSLERLETVLAVLKAGGAYVPLDPAYPRERLEFMVRDAGLRLVVADAAPPSASADAERGVRIVAWSDVRAEVDAQPEGRVGVSVDPAQAAYVIYTSGSTGTPKGTLVEHGALARHALDARAHYGLGAGDRILQFASFNFDASVEQTLPPLIAGACVVLRADGPVSTEALGRTVADEALTILNLPTAQWHVLADEWARGESVPDTSSLRLVIAGGEAMLPFHAARWQQTPAAGARLLNAYGPTEAVVTACAFDVPTGFGESGAARVPIGRALGARSAYVLDEGMRPVAVGAPGELFLGGAQLARGYLGRAALTAERFVPDPFGGVPGARLYRTGDVARRDDAGSLVFLGRVDHQVKVRGYRIELGEVEVALNAHPDVRQSAVVVEEQRGEKQLVAYWIAAGEHLPGSAELRAWLHERLPDYMVPGMYVALEAMPLTVVGKIDRGVLPTQRRIQVDRPYLAPATEIERQVAGIWAEVMGQERASMDDNFFAVGGHSLLATRLTTRIRKHFSIEMPVVKVLENPTLAGLAAVVAEMLAADPAEAAPAIGRASRDGRRVRVADLGAMVEE
jgi:amino acid adenylation domain-containing protein